MNMSSSVQGWAPEAYLEEIIEQAPVAQAPTPPSLPRTGASTPVSQATPNGSARAAAKAKPTPPAPPAKRPNAKGKPVPPSVPRDSAVSLNSQNSSGESGRATPNSTNSSSFAGGLAEALRARQHATQGKQQQDDDDW